jgi:F5/8 type C domain
MYGFPRRPQSMPRTRRVTLQGDGVSTTFLLPTAARSTYPMRVYKTVSGALQLQDPATYGHIRDVILEDATAPDMTITSNGSSFANLIDDDTGTAWIGPYATSGQEFIIDLEEPRHIGIAKIWPLYTESNRYATSYKWDASNNGISWSLLRTVSQPVAGMNTWNAVYLSSDQPFRYFRYTVLSVNIITLTALGEIELFPVRGDGGIAGIEFSSAPAAGPLVIEYVP